MTFRYLSVCSGIEAATVAWHPLGWKAAAFSEIEPFPRAVLAHHYPDVPLHGDFTTIGADDYGSIDLLVGGTPCQSFSIAGLRGGMADERGNLALEYLRLADRKRPRWLVWENVPGVLSSNGGKDFGSFLGALAELGYGFAYRVLDAQNFGVPQRRRRVFVVGYLGDWRRAAAVLFERHSLSGDTPPRREKGQVAPTIHSRSSAGGGLGTDFDCDGGLIPPDCDGVVGALCRQDHGGVDTQTALSGYLPPVAHSLRGEGFDASEAGTGRGTPLVPISFQTRGSNLYVGEEAGTIGANSGSASGCAPCIAIQAGAARENPESGPDGVGVRDDGVAYTLEARAEVQAVAFVQNSRDEIRLFGEDGQTVGALAAEPGMKQQCYVAESHANGGVMPAVAFDMRGREGGSQFEGPHDTANIRAVSCGPSRSYVAASAVRRLTPRECERLQGFPDDYSLVPFRKKPAADGPRYKALGNSMAVPVMRWIGERIAKVDAL